ncbi:MAG: DHA2 family efflux MFS transporter permease subunit [Rhizobiales bacterium]|nr:DHA2 family efflux MFS transporter permease subunit [Hyphomicrobiales bacterium]
MRGEAIEATQPGNAGFATWAGFGALCLGMFMAILDVQVVVTSLSVIQVALDIGADRMSWVQTSYLIAEIIAIPLTALLTRVFSMRLLFAGATILFTVASIACAMSFDFTSMIIARSVQGFAGGILIPLVFAAVFLLFPKSQEAVATTTGGMLAVLAPTLGPLAGGWITENLSWHWLFLINVIPGIAALIVGLVCLPRAATALRELRYLDWASLLALAAGLAAFQIGLKNAPKEGWDSIYVLPCLALFVALASFFIVRGLRNAHPIVELHLFGDRTFLTGCIMSFVLGAGLFGSVYLLPVFLAFVRGHGPLAIGIIMLVTGVTQMISAPLAVQLEKRTDERWLAGFAFAIFAVGLWMSSRSTIETDYDQMFWPQVVRGVGVTLCLLAPTRLALGHLPTSRVNDGSSLFNLMRNLGGAIGIALVDTVLFTRTPDYADSLLERLKAGDPEAARITGISLEDTNFEDPVGLMTIMGDIEVGALTLAANDAWMLLAIITFAAIAALLLSPRKSP